ncbi:MAG: hypothetical protein IPL84_00710 [Chitinophagaceae bacterium]|nr:hypothetical protein [Chitinophagaceae bacterium]
MLLILTNLLSVAQSFDPLAVENTISIRYDFNPALKNVFVSSTASSENDLLHGMNYNYGTALKFSIYSPSTYYVSLSSYPSSYTPASSSRSLREADINNHIFYKIVDNNTGGNIIASNNPQGDILGKTTRPIISNCPPNITAGNNHVPVPANFGLSFRVYPGYSLPPGNYTTQVVLTATYQ